MTTDLDERIAGALGARADRITVTRTPLDEVLAGPTAPPAPAGGGRRGALLAAAAALVAVLAVASIAAVRTGDDGGRVELRPAQAPTTTVPGLGLAYLPEGLPSEPVETTSADGRATVRTHGSGERALEVTVVAATRSPELEAALDARRTEAIVAAYSAGGSTPATGAVPPTPLADEVLGAAASLDDPDRPVPVFADAQAGDDPLLVALGAVPQPGDPIDVGLVAFREGAEVRIAGRGLLLDEALAVLAGLDGPGLAPRPRPAEDPITAAPVPAGTAFSRPAITALPEGWALRSIWGLGGDFGGEEVVSGGAPVGADVATSSYGPVAEPTDPDPDHVFTAGPNLGFTLSHSTPLPGQQEALESGDDEALLEAFGDLDYGIWASGGEARVIDVDGVRLMAATGTVDDSTVPDSGGPHTSTWFEGYLGPDLRIQGQAEGLADDELVAALRSLVIIG